MKELTKDKITETLKEKWKIVKNIIDEKDQIDYLTLVIYDLIQSSKKEEQIINSPDPRLTKAFNIKSKK